MRRKAGANGKCHAAAIKQVIQWAMAKCGTRCCTPASLSVVGVEPETA